MPAPKKPAKPPPPPPPAPAPPSANPHTTVNVVAGALAAAPAPTILLGATGNPPDDLAQGDGVPNLIPFTGFLGGTMPHPYSGVPWRVLYLDVPLQTWLVVEDGEIGATQLMADLAAPTGQRDVVWIGMNAPVGTGSGPQSVEARFLTGEFTRAADFDDSPAAGGSAGAATGVFCQGRSIGCCTPKSRR
jgi:hypothetical protein